jgi:hypothetical protein
MHGGLTIECPAEPLKSKQESGENMPILQFLGFWALVSNSWVVFHLSTHLEQVKLRLND